MSRTVLWMTIVTAACVPHRREKEVVIADSGGKVTLSVPVVASTPPDEGFAYSPRCVTHAPDSLFPHIERNGPFYRFCATQLEMETSERMVVQACDACVIRESAKEWIISVCGVDVNIRVDLDWKDLAGAGWREPEVSQVEYADLYGQSAQKIGGGVKRRTTDLFFRHGGGRQAHIQYSAAPIHCAAQIDEMIERAHVPLTFPGDPFVPLQRDQ